MPLRGAIIGLGNVALEAHLPGWATRADIEIVAGADVSGQRRAAFAARLPGARPYPSADALLADEALDFVDVCTPPSTHASVVRAALLRGLHVLCEKPLALSLDALRPLAALAGARGLALVTVHNWHHAPIVRHLRSLLAEGTVGAVRRLSWQTLRTQPAATGAGTGDNWRLDPRVGGGGILVDHGWHAFYVVCALVGRAPLRVGARLETCRHARFAVEDTARVRVDFEGAHAEVFLSWAADERRNRIEIAGERGTLTVDQDTVALAGAAGERRWTFPAMSTGSQHPDWFAGVADGFLAEASGRTPTRGRNLAEAALCAALIGLAQESSRRGGAPLAVPGALAVG